MNYIDENYVKSIFKDRDTDAHKGNFGKVLIFAGSVGMAGAAILCGKAALQSGAGLVQFLLPNAEDPIYPILQTSVPEATCVFYKPGMDFSSYTSIAAGSGLGKSEERLLILKDIISRYGNGAENSPSNFDKSQNTALPSSDSLKKKILILDADALNLIAEDDLKHTTNDISKCTANDNSKSDYFVSSVDPKQNNVNHETSPSSPHHVSTTNSVGFEGLTNAVINSKADIIITPHIGEAKRLLHTCDGIKSIDQRKLAASALAEKYNCIAVLKGAGTLVCEMNSSLNCNAKNPNFEEHYTDDKSNSFTIFQNTTGNPGMATAGSGDTLTGIIASLAGQGYTSFEAACLGVYFHGKAGDIAAESISQMGITAGDIAHFLPYTFKLV